MKYAKPQIIDVVPAIEVIQSSLERKGVQHMLDSHTLLNNATVGAYEADE